jgi:PPE family protein
MADTAPDATRWQGFTHKDLHRLLHEGAGPAASADPSRRWAEIAGTLSTVGQDLKQAIDRSGSAWSGRAAGAAYNSLGGLVDWAQQGATGATQMRQSVENQADYLAKARADMPTPEDAAPATPDPTGGAVQQVIAAQQDKEPVEASSSTGAQRAFEVMAAYQRNTNANTTGMAPFAAPGQLIGGPGVDHHKHGGVVLDTLVGPITVGAPLAPEPDDHDHHDHHDHQEQHGEHHHHDWDSTTGASFEGDVIRSRPPAPAPGSYTVAAPRGEWFLGATIGWGGEDYISYGRGTGGGRTSVPTGGMPTTTGGPTSGSPGSSGISPGGPGSGGGSTSGPGTGSAAGSGPHSADFQSAAAGQAAAAAGTPAAATPGAAAGTGSSGTASGSADPRALRRFGVDSTIGSGQWFGDAADYEVRGATPTRRRRDLTQPENITESVSVDGEEHQLPHNVIGE